jgi:hypothetical protein
MSIFTDRRYDRGQASIYVLLVLSMVLLGFTALAVDYTYLWNRRQAVQGVADAVCQSSAVDLYLYAVHNNTPTALMNFDPSSSGTTSYNGNFICPSSAGSYPKPATASSAPAPCYFGKFNGLPAANTANTIAVSFPSGVAGQTPPSTSLATYPYVQADVTQAAPTYFSKLINGNSTVNVHASAVCGLVATNGPVPLLVLHPTKPGSPWQGALDIGGSPTIKIVGGPPESIHVNSGYSPTAVHINGAATIDLSQGGPSNTGSNLAVLGGPATSSTGVNLGSTGHYIYPASPIQDPYALWPAPANPSNPQSGGVSVPFLQDGCPDPTGCTEYTAGTYANTITVKGNETAIFQPGLYYLLGGMNLQSNSTVRPSLAAGDGSGGTFFYFSGASTITVNSNSGTQPRCTTGSGNTAASYGPTHCVLPYDNTGSVDSLAGVSVSRALQCTGSPGNWGSNPSQLSGVLLDGNVMLGTCSGSYTSVLGSTYNYYDPSSTTRYRGMLFFQDRSAVANANYSGGSGLLLAGFMYFHQCRSNGTGTGCSLPGSGGYGTTFTLSGGSGSNTYAMGNITTDALSMGGNSTINMILSPSTFANRLQVRMFQ